MPTYKAKPKVNPLTFIFIDEQTGQSNSKMIQWVKGCGEEHKPHMIQINSNGV